MAFTYNIYHLLFAFKSVTKVSKYEINLSVHLVGVKEVFRMLLLFHFIIEQGL